MPSLATLITPQNMEEDAGDEGKEAEADRVNSATDSESVEEMILRKYEFCQKLGKGAFGVVWKVIYKMSRKPAALKKVFHAWRTRRDAQRMYREITYLQALRGHDNIVDMRRMYVCAPPAVEGGPSRLPRVPSPFPFEAVGCQSGVTVGPVRGHKEARPASPISTSHSQSPVNRTPQPMSPTTPSTLYAASPSHLPPPPSPPRSPPTLPPGCPL